MNLKNIIKYLKQWIGMSLIILSFSQAYAQGQTQSALSVCRSLYSIKNQTNDVVMNSSAQLDASEKLYQSIRASYNQGFHSTIFLRPFLKHNIGKMIDKFRQKSGKILDENTFQDVGSVNQEANKRFKNLKMHISETQDQVTRSSLAMLSWAKPWLQYSEYSNSEKNQLMAGLGDSYLGLQTLLLLNIRSERLAGTYAQLENYDAFLVRDIQVIESRQMVLRMDFINDASLDISLRQQAEQVNHKLAKLVTQIKVLRVIVSSAQSVMQQELSSASQFKALYFSRAPIANSDSYLQAKDLISMYLRETENFENKIGFLPLEEQNVMRKLLRTLGRSNTDTP